MPSELMEQAGVVYAVEHLYSVPDDAWRVELSEAVPAPASWRSIAHAKTHLAGPAFITAIVPDEDPSRPPSVHFAAGAEREVPYAVVSWFMESVGAEVERARLALSEAGRAGEASE
jgi:hypothetical protein